jgi:hypothetical protein
VPAAPLHAKAKQRKPWPWHRRLILFSALAAVAYYGAEIWLHMLEEGTHIVLEFLELMIEEFYEHVLHMPRRQAEVFTVWSGALIGLALLLATLRAIFRRIVRTYLATARWCGNSYAALLAWRRSLSVGEIAILAIAGIVIAFMLLPFL